MSSNDNSLAATLGAATVLASVQQDENNDLKKTSIEKIKSANESGKNELQKLNIQLKDYIDKAKTLEAYNQALVKEVELVRSKKVPKVDNKGDLNLELENARIDLENRSKECVKHEANIERNTLACEEYRNRIRFYQRENDLHKNKIVVLTDELNELGKEHEYIENASRLLEEEIINEQCKMLDADNKFEKQREKLEDIRYKNKSLEFELQTLQDEKQFVRALHEEEVAAIKKYLKATPSNVDFNTFYKNELVAAVRDIRNDFQKLSKQQIDDLKAQKENELAFHKDTAEKQKALQAKRAQSVERDVADISLSSLPDSIEQSRYELNQLNCRHNELSNRLASLENDLAFIREKNADDLENKEIEIRDLKIKNANTLNDLEYWERVAKSKLESEIQAYRSILNSQYKLLVESSLGPDKKDKSKVTNLNSQPSSKLPPPQEPVKPTKPLQPSTVIISSAQKTPVEPQVVQPTAEKASSSVIISSATNPKIQTSNTQEPPKQQTPITPQEPPKQQTSTNQNILRPLFDKFDRDHSGKINSKEFQSVLSALDFKITNEAYDKIIQRADKDKSRDIDFNEFCIIMEPALNGDFSRDELYKAFKKFDKDNSGYITVQELQQIFVSMGQNYTNAQVANLIATVDTNSDGRLGFEEFVILVTRPLSQSTPKPREKRVASVIVSSATKEEAKQTSSSPKNENQLRKIFDLFDKDKSGHINSSELKGIMKALNIDFTDEHYNNILKQADSDKSRDIDFDEFCKIMAPSVSGSFSRDELLRAFKSFDKDNSGFITVQELSDIFSVLGQSYTQSDVAKLVASVDKNNDGRLSFDEFVVLMSKPIN